MTAQPLHHGRTGAGANNSPSDAVPLPNGTIAMWCDGRYGPVPRSKAVSELAELNGSPIPSSQARAAAIRAALKETVQ